MRILLAMTLFAAACGGTQPKKESALVNEGEQSPTCCCKTLPTTAEKEIVPNYALANRMECSSSKGDCVDEVQCAGQQAPAQEATPSGGTGGPGEPPPPPTLEPSTSSTP